MKTLPKENTWRPMPKQCRTGVHSTSVLVPNCLKNGRVKMLRFNSKHWVNPSFMCFMLHPISVASTPLRYINYPRNISCNQNEQMTGNSHVYSIECMRRRYEVTYQLLHSLVAYGVSNPKVFSYRFLLGCPHVKFETVFSYSFLLGCTHKWL